MLIHSLRKVHVFLLADREVRFNGIHLRDRCEHCCWTDKISDLHLSDSRDPIDQGCNIGEAEVEVRLFYLSLGSLYCRFRGEVCLDVVVQLAQVEQRSEEHTSELQSRVDLVCRLLL